MVLVFPPQVVVDLEGRRVLPLVPDAADIASVTTEYNIVRVVGAFSRNETFYREAIGPTAVKHLHFLVTIKAFIALDFL
jgi:hypothetical protein